MDRPGPGRRKQICSPLCCWSAGCVGCYSGIDVSSPQPTCRCFEQLMQTRGYDGSKMHISEGLSIRLTHLSWDQK